MPEPMDEERLRAIAQWFEHVDHDMDRKAGLELCAEVTRCWAELDWFIDRYNEVCEDLIKQEETDDPPVSS